MAPYRLRRRMRLAIFQIKLNVGGSCQKQAKIETETQHLLQ